MDKITFASYKFKPSDVIEGLNRYFAETKANRYRRVPPLEIKKGEVKYGFRNIVFDVNVPKVKEYGYYYVIYDPEEVVGVAINWLREEHDIFYAPPKADGFEAKIEPLSSTFYCCDSKLVTETQKLQEENKKLKKKVAEQQKKIDSYESALSKITDIMEPKYAGPAWSETWDDLVVRIRWMKEKVETLEAAKTDWRDSFEKAQDSRSAFCKKLKEELNVDYRYPGCFPKMEEDILLEIKRLKTEHDDVRGLSLKIEELEEQLREKTGENLVIRDNMVKYFEDLAQGRQKALSNLRYEILKVYREIFDCSNGDPEGTDAEVLQDILTEYKRTLELKDVAEEKAVKYKELARENLDMVPVARVREALGIAEDSDIFECFKYRTHQVETLRTELAGARRMYHNAVEERNRFGRRLADIRKAAGIADDDQTDLVEYVAMLRASKETYKHLYTKYEKMYCELRDAKFDKLSEERDRYKWLYENLKNGMESVLQEAEEKED